MGNCAIPSMNQYISQVDPLIPRDYYYYLKGALAKSTVTMIEPIIENGRKEITKYAKRIIFFP